MFDMHTPDGMSRHLRVSTEAIREDLPPDGDWMPIATLVNADHEVAIATGEFGNEEEKDAYVQAVAMLALEGRAVCVGMVATTWMVVMDKENMTREQALAVPPSQHPDREERLMVVSFNADEAIFASAKLTRHPDAPPTMGDWEVMSHGGHLEGAMFSPIQAALELVKHTDGSMN